MDKWIIIYPTHSWPNSNHTQPAQLPQRDICSRIVFLFYILHFFLIFIYFSYYLFFFFLSQNIISLVCVGQDLFDTNLFTYRLDKKSDSKFVSQREEQWRWKWPRNCYKKEPRLQGPNYVQMRRLIMQL